MIERARRGTDTLSRMRLMRAASCSCTAGVCSIGCRRGHAARSAAHVPLRRRVCRSLSRRRRGRPVRAAADGPRRAARRRRRGGRREIRFGAGGDRPGPTARAGSWVSSCAIDAAVPGRARAGSSSAPTGAARWWPRARRRPRRGSSCRGAISTATARQPTWTATTGTTATGVFRRRHPDERRPGVCVRRRPAGRVAARPRRPPARRMRRGSSSRGSTAAPRPRAAGPPGPGPILPRPAGVIAPGHGPGWALVGDAGWWKDPLSTHGITDALRDAELLAGAVVAGAGVAARRSGTAAGRLPGRARPPRLPMHPIVDRLASHRVGPGAKSDGCCASFSSAMGDEVEALQADDPEPSAASPR